MKLLLVDDERYVIESIKKNICWERTGITEIYTAFTMKQAQEIITAVKMDIIISDIVMPAATGFDLVQWVREQNFRIQVIFLTSYAEFDYARRAIQLESVEYLLKPIDFEKLEEALKKAEHAVLQGKQIEKLTEASAQWEKDRTMLQKDIWRNSLSGNMTKSQFCEAAKRMNLYHDGSIFFKPVCFYMDHKSEGTQKWEPSTIEFIMQNVLTELFDSLYVRVDTVLCESEYRYWVILSADKIPEEGEKIKEKELLDQFVHWLTDHMHSCFWCGAGNWSEFSEMTAQADDLRKMHESSLSVWNEVIYLQEFQPSGAVYKNPELDTWKTLLAEEDVEAVITSIHSYLETVRKNEMITQQLLLSLRTDVTQMVYVWLSEMGIYANALFSDKESEKYMRAAVNGFNEMMEYVENLMRKAVGYKLYITKEASVADQICTYIDSHFREEIRRDELAELVYLNTDYMSRMFKKEKGVSISNYILQKRVDEAKKLLCSSSLPINSVSLHIGYSNFSYFTKMFKENTGLTPLEYRRKFGERTQV